MTVTDLHPVTENDTEDPPDLIALLTGDADDDTWLNLAACREIETDVFFPEKGANANAARLICAGCEVRSNCLAAALRQNERHGMWGGLTHRERRPLRRQVPATRTPDRRVSHTRQHALTQAQAS